MSHQFHSLLLAIIGMMAVTPANWAANRRADLLMPRSLERMGLERQWRTHITVDSSRGGIAFITPHVSSTRSRSVFEVTSDQVQLQRFSQDQWRHLGPLGARAEAERQADIAARVLQSLGRPAKVTEQSIPEVTLHVVSDRGRLQILNAASGRTIWSSEVGNPNYPMLSPGVSESFVAVVNGSTLYVLNRETTKLVWKRALTGLPVAGPTLNDEYVLVPLRGGSVEIFKMDEASYLPAKSLASSGVCVGKPYISDETISWATVSGFVYVTKLRDFRSQFRFETGSPIVKGMSHGSDSAIIVATENGHVYSFDESSKKTNWFHFSGEEILAKPLVIDNAVYILSYHGGLARLDTGTGQLQWESTGIQKIVSASRSRLYVLDEMGQMVSVDATTGLRLTAASVNGLNLFLENTVTDRLYIGTYSGQLICLRQADLVWPEIHRPLASQQEKETTSTAAGSRAEDSATEPSDDETDPFAEEADPFSEDNGPADGEDEVDPFGGDENPFADDSEDPFG